jgi:DNA-binding MarR family transcriptional regulator
MGDMNETTVSNLEEHLGYWLRCLSNFVSGSFAEKLSGLDISVAQWVVLRMLYDNKNATLNQAAQLVGVDKSSLSRMIERLVRRNLVIRSEGDDRRSLGLALTPTARKLVPQLAKLADQNDESFFKTLSEKQRKDFLGTIKQLLDANDWKLSERGRDRLD